MQYFVTNFYNIRFFDRNCIPISTAIWDPKWFHRNGRLDSHGCFVDANQVMNGIREESLSSKAIYNSAHDCGACDHSSPETCNFLSKYTQYLTSLDFDFLLSEFNRVAEDVRKTTFFVGEPKIVLLVHEKEDNPCSERWPLIELFKQHGLELKNWSKQDAEY